MSISGKAVSWTRSACKEVMSRVSLSLVCGGLRAATRSSRCPPFGRAVGQALLLQPAPIDDGRDIGAGRNFRAWLERQQPRPLVLQDDAILEKDQLLKANEVRQRRLRIDDEHHRM